MGTYETNLEGQVEGIKISNPYYVDANYDLTEFAKAVEEEDQGKEEEEKAFAAYYVYSIDKSANSYKVGVYGNQVAAASSPNFGATMLQAIAQDVTGVPELKLELRNNLLPINHKLLP